MARKHGPSRERGTADAESGETIIHGSEAARDREIERACENGSEKCAVVRQVTCITDTKLKQEDKIELSAGIAAAFRWDLTCHHPEMTHHAERALMFPTEAATRPPLNTGLGEGWPLLHFAAESTSLDLNE